MEIAITLTITKQTFQHLQFRMEMEILNPELEALVTPISAIAPIRYTDTRQAPTIETLFHRQPLSFIANELRRILLSEVPGLAIDGRRINARQLGMGDDEIYQRLEFIPLTYPESLLETLTTSTECPCKDFCASCSIPMTLDARGRDAFSGDIVSSNPEVQVAVDDIRVAPMRGNHFLNMTLFARKNIPRKNVKWARVLVVVFSPHKDFVDFNVETIEGADQIAVLHAAIEAYKAKIDFVTFKVIKL